MLRAELKGWLFVIAVVMVSVNMAHAQPEVLADPVKCYAIYYDGYNQMPPLQPSMPYDVMVGYLALDSLCRYATGEELKARALAMTEDSLRVGYQLLYSVINYDPALYRMYSSAVKNDSSYKSAVIDVVRALEYSYDQYLQWDSCDATALWTPYIYHIRIENISSYLGENEYDDENSVRVYCAKSVVLRKYKGIIPPDPTFASGDAVEYVTFTWSQIEPNDPANIVDSVLFYKNGNGYMDIGREYVVFLAPYWTSTVYGKGFLLGAAPQQTEMGYWFMPIEDGYVHDKTNFFKMGEFIPFDQFDEYLKNVYEQL